MTADEYVDQYQHGRSGIYPHRVAADLAAEFQITLAEALEIVLRHIFRELAASSKSVTP